jgi:adenine-specific DNA-methyltransferase
MGDDYEDPQGWLFESDAERAKRRNDAIEFYRYKDKWTNRLIAGDSLVIMNSLLEKEGMAGQVQMVYIDPPYGIKYGSNFQPFVNKREVKDKRGEASPSKPEMIKAFRDTWELGIHSYLTHLRDRLLLARELLHESGSVFVQISDENVHHVREICGEVFGALNFVALINFRKKPTPLGAIHLEQMGDYIVFYAKNIDLLKYRHIFKETNTQGDPHWNIAEFEDGKRRKLTEDEIKNYTVVGKTFDPCQLVSMSPLGYSPERDFEIDIDGKKYFPGEGRSWKTDRKGIERLKNAKRLIPYERVDRLRYILKLSDYPVTPITAHWDDTSAPSNMKYVVETSRKPIQRCLLMTTDPGDLVLDITCGSGTTAFVAEQWGRRWITCDTSRVAITLAKKRLMTAVYDYYKLARPEQGVSSGFVYKTVPRITLKSIANNEPPEQATLYDQPEVEKRKVRISGPFTVEALPAPVVKPLENAPSGGPKDASEGPAHSFHRKAAKKHAVWLEELRATGILGRGGEKIRFSRVQTLAKAKFLHGYARIKKEKAPGRPPLHAAICFAGETHPIDIPLVNRALTESETLRPKPAYVIFAAFQFDPAAAQLIDDARRPGLTLLKVQMNTDLMTAGLKKNLSSSQSFWLAGRPAVDLIKIKHGPEAGKYKVRVKGFDYYDVKKGRVESDGAEKIALWMLDPDYDGMSIEPRQVFFPMEGKNEGWDKLAKTLRAEINQDLIEKYHGLESLPFTVKENTLLAVKIVDDRGIESLKVIPVGEK